jgi:hypothetical protein
VVVEEQVMGRLAIIALVFEREGRIWDLFFVWTKI